MNKLTANDIPCYAPATIDLSNGWHVEVKTEYDQDIGPPWEEHDGHGPVSEWTSRDKRPGERLLCSDRSSKRFYNFAEATRIAKRDGWGLHPDAIAKLAAGMGRQPTRKEIAAAAVKNDFEHLRAWANDEWHWIGVIVTLADADGAEVGEDSLWGIEDNSDYWRECAADMANGLIAKHCAEELERAYWEARDVETL